MDNKYRMIGIESNVFLAKTKRDLLDVYRCFPLFWNTHMWPQHEFKLNFLITKQMGYFRDLSYELKLC